LVNFILKYISNNALLSVIRDLSLLTGRGPGAYFHAIFMHIVAQKYPWSENQAR